MHSEKWDLRFLELAATISKWSKDPSTKCGCIIVRPDRTVATMGYNGFPRRMEDPAELYVERDIKYSRVIHAEMNALLTAKESLRGYTLYAYPAWPCDRCAVHMIQAGLVRVVSVDAINDFGVRWNSSLAIAYFREAGIDMQGYKNDIDENI